MDHDGVKEGFATEPLKELNEKLTIPLIASGGAGKTDHFTEVFRETNVDAALAASIFHYKEITIPGLKQELKNANIEVRI
jgi:cyclase